jgi:hypothetical protein
LKNGAAVVPQDGYQPQKADVAVFAGSDAHLYGHITDNQVTGQPGDGLYCTPWLRHASRRLNG